MTLDQWASMAEIFGAFGLIASLIYVGQQVRLNRKQLQGEAAGRFFGKTQEVFSNAALHGDFAAVWSRGATELDSLNKVERERVVNWEIGVIFLMAQSYAQQREGLLGEHFIRSFEWTFTGLGQRESFREAWTFCKGSFDDSFQKYAGRYLE